MAEVQRVIRWYDKAPGDSFAGEAHFLGVALDELQRVFGAEAEDPMYDCWPVRREQVDWLARNLSTPIELDRYDYFVEADAAD